MDLDGQKGLAQFRCSAHMHGRTPLWHLPSPIGLKLYCRAGGLAPHLFWPSCALHHDAQQLESLINDCLYCYIIVPAQHMDSACLLQMLRQGCPQVWCQLSIQASCTGGKYPSSSSEFAPPQQAQAHPAAASQVSSLQYSTCTSMLA